MFHTLFFTRFTSTRYSHAAPAVNTRRSLLTPQAVEEVVEGGCVNVVEMWWS